MDSITFCWRRLNDCFSVQEKEKIIYVYLHESESFVLLNFKGANYNAAFEGLNAATERNDRYAKLLELKQGSDNYSHAYAQTLVRLLKKKEVQVWAPSMQSEACQANAWDIHDTISGQKQQDLRDPWAIAQAKKAAELAAADAAQVPTTLPKLFGLMEGPNAPNAPTPIASPQRIWAHRACGICERAIMLIAYYQTNR
ncbi:hypothetical protein AXG93_812s1250 [Marchantia polymorpha subsp. ruderalis]|uniref:Uncharacterized protein n=1 Tax=Marchantia polymorpha subsp. ruderalis TaxID=1480154 RepID=A0A176VXS9_MARPO|nr:hypothetical protein AXG93_812s1250 [Marchantia polymorpha subsp. ruderalis]